MKKVIITICIVLAVFTGRTAIAASIKGWGSMAIDSNAFTGRFTTIAAGHFHSLALTSDGSIVVWGDNIDGQATPPEGNNFIAIAAGYYHSLALTSDGSIVAWGDNYYGQATPPDENNFTAIAAGYRHSLALTSDGSIVAWGDNYYGQATPPDENNFIAIAAGYYYSLALRSDGSIVGWGWNGSGQATPPDGNNFVAIVGGGSHSLALTSDGSIVGWGRNDYGQATPPAGNNFIAIAAGYCHSLALTSDGSIVGWGDNTYGQATPPAGNNFIAVAAGGYHSFALASDGSIVGWGENQYGQATPPDGNNFIAIAAGDDHSLALVNTKPVADAGPDQTAYAWLDGIAEVNPDGSGSYDIDNQPLTYKWTWSIDGNTYDTNGINPTIELPVGQHVISLIVNDGIEDSEPNEVNITVVGPIEANLNVVPKLLNSCSPGRSRGRQPRITAMLRLPKGIARDQIDTNQTLLLYPGEIEADWVWIYPPICVTRPPGRIGPSVTIFALFDTDELMDAIDGDGRVELAVVGQLTTGQYFFSTDNIRVICFHRWPWH